MRKDYKNLVLEDEREITWFKIFCFIFKMSFTFGLVWVLSAMFLCL